MKDLGAEDEAIANERPAWPQFMQQGIEPLLIFASNSKN